MDNAAIRQVRSFNRIVTERIGALDDRFLQRGRPLGESRVLWEIGPHGEELRVLRSRLGLDSGYLSRLLRSLERQGLVTLQSGSDDRRVRRAFLSKAGLEERAELDRRSDALAAEILNVLTDRQRELLTAAMAETERLLQASMVRFEIADPGSADAQWCINQFFAELDQRFESGFNPDRTISADPSELVPPAGALILARLRGQAVGCGALKLTTKRRADVKRMWLAQSVRGLGLGRRLLHELEDHARKIGVTLLRLETNRALKEAIALYKASGYVEVDKFSDEAYAHHWFEKRLAKSTTRK